MQKKKKPRIFVFALTTIFGFDLLLVNVRRDVLFKFTISISKKKQYIAQVKGEAGKEHMNRMF